MYSARLACRLPPRLRRWRTTLPEEVSMGETPHRLANEASLLNLLGLSLRPRSTASRRCRCRCQARRPAPGRPLPPADRGAPPARLSLPRGPRSGGPPTGARTWWPLARQEGHLRGEASGGRRGELLRGEPAQTAAQLLGRRLRKACSWLAACVLALMAERRAARRALLISTRPSALLGTPDASPAKTARAAASASEGTLFSTLRREAQRLSAGGVSSNRRL
jgi:hypothetical protein